MHLARLASAVQPMQARGLNLWILKPSCLSRGRGIFLLDSASNAVCQQPSVVQRYIADPLLLHGHKFDLRLYVCVTSFNPLEAFMYQVSC
jgi:tubulin polyglutamylase TTLL5